VAAHVVTRRTNARHFTYDATSPCRLHLQTRGPSVTSHRVRRIPSPPTQARTVRTMRRTLSIWESEYSAQQLSGQDLYAGNRLLMALFFFLSSFQQKKVAAKQTVGRRHRAFAGTIGRALSVREGVSLVSAAPRR